MYPSFYAIKLTEYAKQNQFMDFCISSHDYTVPKDFLY